MALINRVTRLFRADMNAVLDQLEEPQTVLRQAIRDMEAQLDGTASMLRDKRRALDVVTARQKELAESLAETDQHLDVCFESEEHDLARDMTRRKLETQRLLKRLDSQAQELERELEAALEVQAERQDILAGLSQKAEVFAAEATTENSGGSSAAGSRSQPITASEVEAAYLSEMKRRASS